MPHSHETTENLGQMLIRARLALRQAEIESAELDARLLVQWLCQCELTDLVVRADMPVAAETAKQLHAVLKRRIAGEPVHRIIGEREFYGLNFTLNAATLEPRPDTEALIDLVLPFLRDKVSANSYADLLDMGTGSGAIAITLLHEVAQSRGVAVDIAQDALKAVRINATRAGVAPRLAALHSNWFAEVRGKFDLIVSNPPYIPAKIVTTLEIGVKDYDPRLALDGGVDGLDFYRSLAQLSPAFLRDGGMVAVEIGAGQADDVTRLFTESGFRRIAIAEDLGGHVRALSFQH